MVTVKDGVVKYPPKTARQTLEIAEAISGLAYMGETMTDAERTSIATQLGTLAIMNHLRDLMETLVVLSLDEEGVPDGE